MATTKKTDSNSRHHNVPLDWSSIFVTKATYAHIGREFHAFHQHHANVALHLVTTGIGTWAGLQLATLLSGGNNTAAMVYVTLIVLTTPWWPTAVLHTLFCYAALQVPVPAWELPVVGWMDGSSSSSSSSSSIMLEPVHVCVMTAVLAYAMQDVAHWLCVEPTYMGSYLTTRPGMLGLHTFWLLPLVLDAVCTRHWFMPLVPIRNRCVVEQVASKSAVDTLRAWVHQHVPSVPETTHVWPHQQAGTAAATVQLEQDAAILAGFRKVFDKTHYDVQPIQGMNEIYITAVGAKKNINSDAVFYTPHTDGPYWWLPCASVYRVLVGITPNQVVRTRYNLQTNQDQVLDLYGVVGFDYNRELHWIDHVPNTKNDERRSLVKLHYVVYPRGWLRYGKLVASWNTAYNTWARGNFLQTLRPATLYDYALAWWIWTMTWANALLEEYVGWQNLVYVGGSFVLSRVLAHVVGHDGDAFMILTSFRHYVMYVTTLAYRTPPVAHGYLMRDAKLYKTLSMMHLAGRMVPLVQWQHATDVLVLAVASLGWGTTLWATYRLGMVRTYFGAELGLVKPRWIDGFPYNYLPHPMILGQVWGFAVLLAYWRSVMPMETQVLLMTHMTCYLVHMVQEMLTSSY